MKKEIHVRARITRLAALTCLIAAAVTVALLERPGSAIAGRASSTITIAVTGPTATQDVPFLAQSKGYFAKRGLNVDVTLLPPAQAIAAVAAGQVQFIEGGEPGGASTIDWSSQFASSHNKPVKLLGYWQPTAGGIVMVGRPGIDSVSQLKGKTVPIAQPGGATALFVNLTLWRAGHLKPNDAKIAILSTLQAEVAAFTSGRVSAMIATQPLTTELLQGVPGSKVIFDLQKWHWVLGGIAGYMPWVQSHPGQTVKVLAAINDALADYHSSPADAEAVIGQVGDITDQSLLQSAYKGSIPFITQQVQPISAVGMEYVLQTLKKNGTPAADPRRWKEEVDNRYALQALKIK
jgi:ABC-type nitrate/sulfonate/bicarbonate transport system substrate-binding protein